jgi:hypothetical protein
VAKPFNEYLSGRVKRPALVLLPVVAALLATPASARESVAPLPEGVQASNAAKVHGLYADVEFSRVDVNSELEALESECKARGREPRIEGRELAEKGKLRIYRSRISVAVFEDAPTLKVDREGCSAVITLARTATVRTGPWPSIRTYDWDDQPPSCDRLLRCWRTKVAGVKAQCVDLGDGLMGSSLCYSVQDDLSKNLVVMRTTYSDDGSRPNTLWALDRVLTDVLIDPAVFSERAEAPPR